MSLHGTSESFGFTEILQVLAARGKTGRLVVRGGSTEGAFFFDRGRVRGMLGRGGAIIAPVTRTAEDRDSSPWPEAGVELTAALLRAPHVAFVFEPDIPWPDVSSPSPHGRVNRLLTEGQIRVGEWREVEKVIPSLELRPTLVVQIGSQVVLEPDEWRLLTAVDGRRSVSALARAAGLSPLGACQRLVRMLERGLIDLEAAAAPRASVNGIVQMPDATESVTQVPAESPVASSTEPAPSTPTPDPIMSVPLPVGPPAAVSEFSDPSALPPPSPADLVPPSVMPGDGVPRDGVMALPVGPFGSVDSDPAGGSDGSNGSKGRRWQRRSMRRSA